MVRPLSTPLNRLPVPRRLPHFRDHQFRPGAQALKAYSHPEDPDTELILEAMQDDLLAGIADLQGLDMPPQLLDEPDLALLFQPTPGRCLWSWGTLLKLDEVRAHPELLNPTPLLNLALKPSDTYPKVLQGVTPRLAAQLAGVSPIDLERVIRWLVDEDILAGIPSRSDMTNCLAAMPYGGGLDARLEALRLPAMPEEPPPSRSTKRRPAQHYALRHSDPKVPLPRAILEHPPLSVELGPQMHATFQRAMGFVRRWADQALRRHPKADDYFRDIWDKALSWDLAQLEVRVVPHYLTGDWDFHLLYGEQLPAQQHLELALVRGMAHWRYRGALWRYQQPTAVLALSLITGISPAIFVRSNAALLTRTGIPFLREAHIDAITQRIRALTPSRSAAAQSRREALIAELEGLLEEFVRLQDTLPAGRVDEALRLSSGMPAWGVGADPLGDDD